MKFVGDEDPDSGADGREGKSLDEIEERGLHQIVERSIDGQRFRQQRACEHQEIDQKEQADKQRD